MLNKDQGFIDILPPSGVQMSAWVGGQIRISFPWTKLEELALWFEAKAKEVRQVADTWEQMQPKSPEGCTHPEERRMIDSEGSVFCLDCRTRVN